MIFSYLIKLLINGSNASLLTINNKHLELSELKLSLTN
jgi:hypothetical protein